MGLTGTTERKRFLQKVKSERRRNTKNSGDASKVTYRGIKGGVGLNGRLKGEKRNSGGKGGAFNEKIRSSERGRGVRGGGLKSPRDRIRGELDARMSFGEIGVLREDGV